MVNHQVIYYLHGNTKLTKCFLSGSGLLDAVMWFWYF